jgi:hypothetical protein
LDKCPKQKSNKTEIPINKLFRDNYGEIKIGSAGHRDICLNRRKKEHDSWCGTTNTETFY